MIIPKYRMSLACGLFILILCGIPGEDLPKGGFWDFRFMDKLAHITLFSILNFLLIWETRKMYGTLPSTMFSIVLVGVGIAFGGLTELFQHFFFSGRYADLSDFIADALGAICGTFLATRWFINRP